MYNSFFPHWFLYVSVSICLRVFCFFLFEKYILFVSAYFFYMKLLYNTYRETPSDRRDAVSQRDLPKEMNEWTKGKWTLPLQCTQNLLRAWRWWTGAFPVSLRHAQLEGYGWSPLCVKDETDAQPDAGGTVETHGPPRPPPSVSSVSVGLSSGPWAAAGKKRLTQRCASASEHVPPLLQWRKMVHFHPTAETRRRRRDHHHHHHQQHRHIQDNRTPQWSAIGRPESWGRHRSLKVIIILIIIIIIIITKQPALWMIHELHRRRDTSSTCEHVLEKFFQRFYFIIVISNERRL